MRLTAGLAMECRWIVLAMALLSPPAWAVVDAGLKIHADSEEAGYEVRDAIDGDPNTLWHTPYRNGPTRYPHYVQIEFTSPQRLCGFSALPRQDGNRNGWICDFAFYASDDGENWGDPVTRGTFAATKDLQTVRFERPVSGRFFLLAALSSFAGPHASLAEFELLEQGDSAPDQTGPRPTDAIVVDGRSPGLTFDGVGAVSAGGSTRLLIDYPEPARGQILDYLFRPDYGAALHLLKVEIGADADTTCGAEPSHQRTPDRTQCDLGYEWWLMKEAKARNPEIKLCGLAWGAPGWLQGGFWSDDNVRYTLAWLECARCNGLYIDYLGGGNERGWDANYYIQLRRALDEHGFAHVKVVATDDHSPPNYWAVADEMKTNREFAEAVDVLGQHDVCVWRTEQRHCYVGRDAAALGKPLWDSENSTQDYAIGHEPLARAMNRHYIEGRITANFNWSLVGSYYGTFPAPGTGLLLADRPWSGWFGVGKSVWVDAHTTQFARPGWRYLDSACGYTAGGASYVALRSPVGEDYSIIIETMDLAQPQTLEITVAGGLSHSRVSLWQTNLRSEREADHFVKARTLKPARGTYRVTIQPGYVYTLSTTTGQRKGGARLKAEIGRRMPLPFQEDFEDTGDDRLAKFFSDVHGGFEAVPCGGGRSGTCYRQMVAQEPLLWHRAKMPPTTIVGDPLWWGDYEVSADALLEGTGYVELLGRVESQQHNVGGYHLQVSDTGAWSLYTQDEQDRMRVLASGADSPFGVDRWHRLALRFRGSRIVARLDDRELADIRDDAHTTGQVGLRVSPWQHAQFDNFHVERTAPWPEFIPHSEMTATATSEHRENDFGTVHVASNAIDDRVETSWRSRRAPAAPLPQSLTLDLHRNRKVCALTYRPEMAGVECGTITGYHVYISTDGRTFEKVASGRWKASMATKVASWPPRRARYVRLEAVETTGDPRYGAVAGEIELSATPIADSEG